MSWPDYGIESVIGDPIHALIIAICISTAIAVSVGWYLYAVLGPRRDEWEANPIQLVLGQGPQRRIQNTPAAPAVSGRVETQGYQDAYEAMLALKFTKMEAVKALDKAVDEGANQDDANELLSKAVRQIG